MWVLGEPTKASDLRQALESHGVDHAAVVAHVGSIRRRLVLGENEFVVVCIALDEATMTRQGSALRRLLNDHRCFPTAIRTIGLLSDLGLTPEVAELGCDVYVDDSAQAAETIRLLDDAWAAEAAIPPEPERASTHLHVHGGWMCGSPDLPAELTSLIPTGTGHAQGADPDPFTSSTTPPGIERSSLRFGDRRGPP